MIDKTTLPRIYWPLMDCKVEDRGYCAICGRPYPTERHHIVRRGAGSYFRDGELVRKPEIRLCGFGNNLKDTDGRYYCHGKAHSGLLHFRMNDGHLEFLDLAGKVDLITAGSLRYQDVLEMDGWMPLRDFEPWSW